MAQHSAIDQDYMQPIFWHMRYTHTHTRHIAFFSEQVLYFIRLVM